MVTHTIVALNHKNLAYAKQSEDGTWTTGSTTIGVRTLGLAVDPHQPETIYIGTDREGVLRTENYGATWTPVGLQGQIVRSLAISALQPGTIYAGTKPAHLYVSHDHGANWSELPAFRRMKRWWWFTPGTGSGPAGGGSAHRTRDGQLGQGPLPGCSPDDFRTRRSDPRDPGRLTLN